MAKAKGPPIPTASEDPSGRCEGCTFRWRCQGFVDWRGPSNADYMIIGEAPGREEVETGMPFIGGSGRVLYGLARRNCEGLMSNAWITNVVKCRPIVWTTCIECWAKGCAKCEGKGQVRAYNSYGDYVNATPTRAQIEECASRFLIEELEEFKGHTIIGLGAIPLHYMVGYGRQITKVVGSVYTPGDMVACVRCSGDGTVPRPKRKCGVCRGKGRTFVFSTPIKCKAHPTYKGKTLTKRMCLDCWKVYTTKHPLCETCKGEALLPRPAKVCPECKGSAYVPSDPDNPFVSRRLKEGQVYFPLLHPAYLMKGKQGMFPVMERAFRRIPRLHDELKEEISVDNYRIYPPEGGPDEGVPVVLDLEHKGMQPEDAGARLVCVGVSDGPGRGFIYKPDDPRALTYLKQPLIIGQNWVLHDAWWIYKKYGLTFNRVWDTMLAGHLLNPDTPNDLVYLAAEFAEPPMRGYWKSANDYRDHIEQVCAMDVDATYRVYLGERAKLRETDQLNIMEKDIIPLSSVVFDIRRKGMKVNAKKMVEEAKTLDKNIARERTSLPWEGTENQSQEVIRHLYHNLRLPVQIDNDGRKPTSRARALQELLDLIAMQHKSTESLTATEREEATVFIRRVLRLREMSKLANTFLKQRLSGRDTVHPILNPRGTATLRMSCSDPNAQNFPGRARSIFIPDRPDWRIFRADLAQAEVIGLLWFAQQWDVLKRVLEGHDVHAIVAGLMFDKSPDAVTKEERTAAKTTTFALLYGEHPETTAARLGISLEDIMEIRRKYFEALPGVAEYRESTISHSMAKGYVASPFNVRRYIRCNSPVGHAANQAANAPIQNIPAMVTRRVMVQAAEQLPGEARVWMQVHDEVNVTGPQDKEVAECLYDLMTQGIPEMMCPWGPLKFRTTVEIGPSWGDLTEYSMLQH